MTANQEAEIRITEMLKCPHRKGQAKRDFMQRSQLFHFLTPSHLSIFYWQSYQTGEYTNFTPMHKMIQRGQKLHRLLIKRKSNSNKLTSAPQFIKAQKAPSEDSLLAK